LKDCDPIRILKDLEFVLDCAISRQNDLLIFDEIQACSEALTKNNHKKKKTEKRIPNL